MQQEDLSGLLCYLHRDGSSCCSCLADVDVLCRPKIVEGRLSKIRSQKALLEQPFIKDTGNSVAEHIKAAVASLGENIQVSAAWRLQF